MAETALAMTNEIQSRPFFHTVHAAEEEVRHRCEAELRARAEELVMQLRHVILRDADRVALGGDEAGATSDDRGRNREDRGNHDHAERADLTAEPRMIEQPLGSLEQDADRQRHDDDIREHAEGQRPRLVRIAQAFDDVVGPANAFARCAHRDFSERLRRSSDGSMRHRRATK